MGLFFIFVAEKSRNSMLFEQLSELVAAIGLFKSSAYTVSRNSPEHGSKRLRVTNVIVPSAQRGTVRHSGDTDN